MSHTKFYSLLITISIVLLAGNGILFIGTVILYLSGDPNGTLHDAIGIGISMITSLIILAALCVKRSNTIQAQRQAKQQQAQAQAQAQAKKHQHNQ